MKNRKGFTLIELLIVVVIIGILAAIAIPKFANTKEKAVVASMKSDLRNLVTAQEGFFSDNQDYAGSHWRHAGQRRRWRGRGGLRPVGQQRGRDQLHRRRGLVRDGHQPGVISASNDVCGIFVGDPATYSAGAGLAATDVEGAPKCY